jgi:hypothetical protein
MRMINIFGWVPLAILIFIIGMSCSTNFSNFMVELVR